MASQVANGKAFEWAVAQASAKAFDLPIKSNASSENAERSFNALSSSKAAEFESSASKAIEHISRIEIDNPLIVNAKWIEIASDSRGIAGDVRDVLLASEDSEIGFSCKTNHDALKHSRLSSTIDFAKSWGLSESGCSPDYWNAVKPLFAELKQIKTVSSSTALFENIADLPENYYFPILKAFKRELLEIMGTDGPEAQRAAAAFVRYVIGVNDFYKIMNLKKETSIQGFNFGGSLSIGVSKLPDRLVSVDEFDGGNFSVTTRFNKGYTFNFRIHNASSRVEPSFKFDIRGISFESEVYQHHFV